MEHTKIITDREIYSEVIQHAVPNAEQFVWIGTSDIKDMYVHKGKRMVPFLQILSDLLDRNVMIRLIHAKEPGPAFRADFDRYPNLAKGLERLLCPRTHFKCVIVDGTFAYTGSANVTGAGMGAKSEYKRNFETGIATTNPDFVEAVLDQFDAVWRGGHCRSCKRKEYCADVIDMIPEEQSSPDTSCG